MIHLRSLLLVASLVITGGCYRYVPVTPAAAPPGSDVRASLTDRGQQEMVRLYGPGVTSVDGSLVAWNAQAIQLRRQASMRRPGFPATTVIDTLTLSSDYVSEVGLRTLDGGRTAVLSAVIVGAGVASLFAAKIFGGTSDEPPEGGGEIVDDAVVIRIPIRIGIW